MRRDDHEEDVRRHDRPEHRADLEIGRPAGEDLARGVRRGHDEPEEEDGHQRLDPNDAAGDVVEDPRGAEPEQAERDRRPRGDVPNGRVDQVGLRVEVVEDDEQCEPGEPGRVRLPLEPVQRLRELARGDRELRDPVEAAAVDLPRLAADAVVDIPLLPRPPEVVVERDEVERGADPDDPCDDVEPPDQQVEPVVPVRVDQRCCHRSFAIATSSPIPVSSSSSRDRSRRSLSTGRISARERPSTKTTKRKPNFSS